MHFSGLCKRDTCLFDNTLEICHWMGIEKVQKKQAFLFLSLIVLMPFVPVELFILAIKGKKTTRQAARPRGSGSRVWFLVGAENARFWYSNDFLGEHFGSLFFTSLSFLLWVRFFSRKEGRGVFHLAYKYVTRFVFTKSLYNSGKFHLVEYCAVTMIRRLDDLEVFSHLQWINVLVWQRDKSNLRTLLLAV